MFSSTTMKQVFFTGLNVFMLSFFYCKNFYVIKGENVKCAKKEASVLVLLLNFGCSSKYSSMEKC